jgi:hypothetical protein
MYREDTTGPMCLPVMVPLVEPQCPFSASRALRVAQAMILTCDRLIGLQIELLDSLVDQRGSALGIIFDTLKIRQGNVAVEKWLGRPDGAASRWCSMLQSLGLKIAA